MVGTKGVWPGAPILVILLVLAVSDSAAGQDNYQMSNYEVEVYGSKTVAPRTMWVETFTNLTADGTKPVTGSIFAANQLYPTNNSLHETVEGTMGIKSWSEVGFYVFQCARSGQGWQWVGDHIRGRAQVPERWHWPVGAGVSVEFGYQRPRFSTDTWTVELRPIVDRDFGRWYFAANPAFERSLHGSSVQHGVAFTPSLKVSYEFNKYVSGGAEYYGGYGDLRDISSFHNQQQQFFPTVDLNVSPDWTVNFGFGIGVTTRTDDWIYKANLARRFDWPHRREQKPGDTDYLGETRKGPS